MEWEKRCGQYPPAPPDTLRLNPKIKMPSSTLLINKMIPICAMLFCGLVVFVPFENLIIQLNETSWKRM